MRGKLNTMVKCSAGGRCVIADATVLAFAVGLFVVHTLAKSEDVLPAFVELQYGNFVALLSIAFLPYRRIHLTDKGSG